MDSNRRSLVVMVLAGALAMLPLAACSKHEGGKSGEKSPPPNSELSDALWMAAAPADAQPVLATRDSKKDGDAVVVTGRAKDFVDGLAVFTMTDASLPSCAEEGEMKDCETPWDYCCTDPAIVARATANVEFHDAAGVVTKGVRGFHGLDHLKKVTVKGTLKRDEAGNLTVLATGLHVD